MFQLQFIFYWMVSQVSKFHRLRSDEQWHFYDGASIKIFIIDEKGKLKEIILGKENREWRSFSKPLLRKITGLQRK
jgi:predicted cupin superfamily sugar epimerase